MWNHCPWRGSDLRRKPQMGVRTRSTIQDGTWRPQLYCSQCFCYNYNELTQSHVQGEGEYGACYEHEGRLLWKSICRNGMVHPTALTPGALFVPEKTWKRSWELCTRISCRILQFGLHDPCWSCTTTRCMTELP